MGRLLVALLLAGCAATPATPPPNVRLVSVVAAGCKFIHQESCTMKGNRCEEWHRSNAAAMGANAMAFVHQAQDNRMFATNGNAFAISKNSITADYYACP